MLFPTFSKFWSTLNILLAILLTSGWLHAAPYGPEGMPIEFTQPDGTKLSLRVFGDDFYGRTETSDGYTVVFDPVSKAYHYATLSPDGNEFASTGRQVSKVDPNALGLAKRLEINPTSRAAKARKNAEAHEAVVKQQERWDAVKAASKNYRAFKDEVKKQEKAGKKGFVIPLGTVFPDSEIPPAPQMAPVDGKTTQDPPIAPAPPSFTLTGDVVGLTILVDFSDVPGTVVTQAQIDDYFNKPGYTGFSQAGSVYDYFFIQSGGKLRYNNNVTYYVRVPQPKTYYNVTTTDSGLCGRSLLNDALNVLIANGYDFSKLTTKAGGNIRACNVFFAGADSGVWSKGLWPHRWVLSPSKSVGGGKYVYDYQITNIGTTAALKIGTVCHENGHMLLGYPDLYSYDGNAGGVGNFSLMDGGNYGGSPAGTHPVNIDPYLKEASGWMDVIDLNSASNQRCTVQADGNQVYRYNNPAKATEYFLFEVRDNTGYEGPYGGQTGSVNPSAGVVAYHVYETGSNTYSSIFTPSATDGSVPAGKVAHDFSKPFEMMVVEANPKALNAYQTYWYEDPTPDTADAFKAAGKSAISDTTSPELKFWNPLATGGGRTVASGCDINSISADGSVMTFIAGAAVPSGTPNIVLSRSTLNSYCNFGATAASQTFTICNGQGGTLNYTITDDQPWLSCTPASGTATTETDSITINYSTSGLAAGTYTATITVNDPAALPATKTITVSLTVTAQPAISLSVASIAKAGIAGVSGPQATFAINNTGGGALNYTVSTAQTWLSLSPASGTVVAETDTIYVNFNATSLAAGTYNGSITVTSAEANNSPLTIPVTFTVDGADMIVAVPNGGEKWVRGTTQNITWASGIGGNVKIELYKNGVLNATLSASTPNDGSFSWSIPAGQAIGSNYRVRITSVETPATFDQSFADFTIAPPPIYYASMDTNPGWTMGTSWAYGPPTGAGQDAYGGPDPTSGQNGANVIGYRLDGDYEASIGATRWVTTPAINCTGRQNVILSFQRWLGVEQFAYDKAYIEVSNNGTTWTQVWVNPAADTNDSAWTYCQYDISAVANNQATVYIRWGMGTTDGSWNYCGWNIDEVLVDGDLIGGGYAVVVTQSGGATNVTEGGATDTYTLQLAQAPTSNVTVTVAPNSQLSVSPTSLTFTTANWATPQTVTVTAFNDAVHEFAHTGTIAHTASSADTNYNAIGIDGILVQITDNDNVAPVTNAGLDQTVTLVGGVWSPAELNPIAWYDATDAATITQAGGLVSQWNSKTGTSHMLQATSAKRPLTGTTQINGLNSISFDGTDDALKTAANPFGASISDAMCMAVTNIGTITGSTIFSLSGSSANRWQSHAPWSDGSLYFDCGGASAPNRINAASGWAAGQNKLLGYYCSTTDSLQQVWVDGTSLISDATGHTVTVSSGLALGHDGTSSYDNCAMGEVVILNGVVPATNRQKLEGYLAHKWGLAGSLPAAHPYKSVGPNSPIAIANLDGTISDADSDPLTSTWSVVSGPGSVAFGNINAVDTTASFTVEGIYTLRLTANDSIAQTIDDVVITVGATTGYTVSYNGNGNTGGTAPSNQTKTALIDLTLATNSGNLVKTGYTFAGWNTLPNGTGTDYAAGSTYATDANLALYAKWTPNTYTVTYNANSATSGTAPSNQTKIQDISLTLATNSGSLARTGYTFAGWNTAADGTGTSYAAGGTYTANTGATLYAKWTPNTYTVTYNANGATSGTVPANQTKIHDINLTLATNSGNLALSGYTFAGWNTLANGTGTAYATGAIYTANAGVTLYAQWTAVPTYTVIYNGNGNDGGVAPSNQTKTQGVNLTISGAGTLVRTGYNFAGWNTVSGGTGTAYAAGATYSIDAEVTLYAQWTIQTYVVSYNGNSNTSGSVPSSQTKTYNVSLTLATNTGNLARTGYTFAGWNTAANGSGSDYLAGATYTANAAVILYAKWTPNTYTVSYNANSATSGTAPTSQTKTQDVNLTLATNSGILARTGYTFSGWNTAMDGTGTTYAAGGTYSANAAVILYAKWVINTYTVTYNANGATSGTAPANQTKTHDVNLTLATNSGALTRSGYSFTGWNTAADGTGTPYASGATYSTNAAITLYAKWTVVPTFTVSYNGNGNTGGTAPANQTKTQSIDLTLSGAGTLVRTGYNFTGWNTASNGTGTPYAAGATYSTDAVLTLYAQWSIITYAITYDGNGSTSGSAPGNQTKTYDVSLVLAANSGSLARTGYTFEGWNTAADGSGTNYATGATYADNAAITLYAKWTIITYIVNYNANGASSGSVPTNQTKDYGVKLNLSANVGGLVRNGYTFSGWNTAANGSGTSYAEGALYEVNANLTLYAKWTLNIYTVTYNGNGNTGGTAPVDVTAYNYNNTVTVLAQGTLTKSPYNFTSWNTQPNGTGTAYYANSTFAITANVTLYAQWNPGPVTIYEPFADLNTTLTGNTVGDGLSGTWTAATGFAVNAGSLAYGSLPTSGGCGYYTGAAATCSATLGSALSTNGLLADGSTLWFSMILSSPITATGSSDTGFAIGTSTLGSGNNIPMSNGEQGIGFAVNGNQLHAASWSAAKTQANGPTINANTVMLVVGKIVWGASSDVLSLYLPDTALNLGSVVSTQSAVLSQSTFDTISFGLRSNTFGFDEIRFGSTYESVIGVGGSGPVDHFDISPVIASPQTVGTPITGINIVAKNASNQTANFSGPVTFGGTAGVTGTSANFVLGVLNGVSITPTNSGNNLTFTVNDGAGHTGSAVFTVQSLYSAWSGNAFANGALTNKDMTFDFDGDGLANGIEWVIGGDPTLGSDSASKAPVMDTTADPNYFIYSYRRTDIANADVNTSIVVEYGNNLSGWTTALDDGTNVIITPSDDFYGAGVDKVDVKIKRTLAPSGKLFSRLKVVIVP